MKYEITDESLSAAIKFLESAQRFSVAIAVRALCVPQELEGEGWMRRLSVVYEGYLKGKYELYCYRNSWKLWLTKGKLTEIATISMDCFPPKSVQAWADAEIAKFEAGQLLPSCNYCGIDLPAQHVPWRGYYFCDNRCNSLWLENHTPKPVPKPFGPGTVDYEARARLLKDMPDQEVAGFLRIVDEVGNKFQNFIDKTSPGLRAG